MMTLAVACTQAPPKENQIAITAHRGFWDSAVARGAQNSIASLGSAQAIGVWGTEFDLQLTVDDILINTLQQHLALLMRQLIHLIVQLVMPLDKLIELLVQWRTSDGTAGIVDMNLYLALLDDNRHHQRFIVHIEISQFHGVDKSGKPEFSMYHITGVHILQLLILDSFQIEFAAIKR